MGSWLLLDVVDDVVDVDRAVDDEVVDVVNVLLPDLVEDGSTPMVEKTSRFTTCQSTLPSAGSFWPRPTAQNPAKRERLNRNNILTALLEFGDCKPKKFGSGEWSLNDGAGCENEPYKLPLIHTNSTDSKAWLTNLGPQTSIICHT